MRRAGVLLILALLVSPSRAADPAPRKGVLLLYDENGDFTGLAQLDRSLKAALAAGGVPGGIDVYTEFMDISRFRDADYQAKLRDFYRQKYAGKRIDLMVGVMAPSLEFLLKHGQEISPTTPIVFCGIDARELAGRTLPSNATGVLVKREFAPTLESALRFHPGAREVFFVAGTSDFNQFWLERARRELAGFEKRVKITYLSDLSIEALQDRVAHLPPDSVILFLHLFRDGAGRTFNPNESLALVAQKANVPLYVFFDQYVGAGAVGGYVYSVEAHGAKAGEIATRILKGEPPSSIPTAEVSANVNLFDARQLRRWNIDDALLPPGAIVRFREPSFWELYRGQVVVACAVIVAEAMLIFALLFQRRRRTIAERANKQAQAELQQKRSALEHFARVAALGELTATLTHELNQPLGAIQANASAGALFLDDPNPDIKEVRGALLDIGEISRRAGEIVQGIRRMLRRETPGFTKLDLNHAIHVVERITHSDALQHDVAVRLDLAPDLPPVNGDDVELQQCILNLMLNAFAAMSDPALNGAPRLLVVRTTASPDRSSVLLEVRDAGPGIPSDKLESIFDPFVTTKPGGLGMGLSICRSIIDRHRGRIRASNNPDRGATFSITLPIAAP